MNRVQNSSSGPSTLPSRDESDFAIRNLQVIKSFKERLQTALYPEDNDISDLSKAIENEDVSAVENCLSNPLNSISQHQVAYLQMAMKTRNRKIFGLLLERKDLDLSPNERNADLFVYALEMKNRDGDYFALELAKRGFNPNPALDSIFDLLEERVDERGQAERLKLFAKYLKFLKYNERGNNPLHQAIIDRDWDEFKNILKRDVVVLDAYNRNNIPALHLALAFWDKYPDDPDGLKMVKALLKKGADPHQKYDQQNFWDLLILLKPQGWDAVMAEFFEGDAHFSTDKQQRVTNKIDGLTEVRAKAIQKEQIHRKAMATILGIEFEDGIGGSSSHRDGGVVGWEAFDNAMKGIEEFSCTDPSMEDDFENMKKAMRLAQSLSYYKYHYDEQWDQVSKETLWKQVKQAFNEEYPVMIPVHLDGHAISIIFYQDQVMICNRGYSPNDEDSGIHVYEWSKPLTKKLFFDLIERHDASNEKQFLNRVHQDLGLVKKHVVKLTDQEHENCVWASTISPGMKAVLLMLRLDGSFEDIDETFEKIKPFAKDVNHSVKFHMVDTYIKSMFKFMRKTGEEPCYAMLGKLVQRFVYKIEAKKDSKGYYKRALDAIIFSGASLSITKKKTDELTQEEIALTQQLARIYHVKPQSLNMKHRFV